MGTSVYGFWTRFSETGRCETQIVGFVVRGRFAGNWQDSEILCCAALVTALFMQCTSSSLKLQGATSLSVANITAARKHKRGQPHQQGGLRRSFGEKGFREGLQEAGLRLSKFRFSAGAGFAAFALEMIRDDKMAAILLQRGKRLKREWRTNLTASEGTYEQAIGRMPLANKTRTV